MTVRAGKRTEYCPCNRIVKLVKLALKGQLPIRLLRLFADHVQVSGTVPYIALCAQPPLDITRKAQRIQILTNIHQQDVSR